METNAYICTTRKKRMKKITFGLLVIAAGALLLAFNAGLIDHSYKHLIFSWQMLLIGIGLINIFDRDNWVVGTILITIGSFFIAPHLVDLTPDFTKMFWPVILIIVGVMIVIKKGFGNSKHQNKEWKNTTDFNLDMGYIVEKNVFGGSKNKVAPCEFKGGRIQNVFGGTELDLTQTTLAEGKNVLEIKCVFGGIGLIVPQDWVIHIETNSVMGGFVDKRRNPPTIGSARELYIKGDSVFGGGDIKS
jgi:predicted membrane protein